MGRAEIQEAVGRLDDLTRRLRRECPWDRQQDERSIVPHTVEEAYELADAAQAGDDAKLRDELGDVLFQVHFLSLLLEERGAGDLAGVAEHCREKLIRRHPHVFSPEEMADLGLAPAVGAADVLRNWEAIKRTEPGRQGGIFGEVPENLPAPLLARKVQRRAASAGFDGDDLDLPLAGVHAALEELEAVARDVTGESARDQVGDLLFAVVNVARKLTVDPELALRTSAERFRRRVETAEALAAEAGDAWTELDFEAQLSYYARARLTLED